MANDPVMGCYCHHYNICAPGLSKLYIFVYLVDYKHFLVYKLFRILKHLCNVDRGYCLYLTDKNIRAQIYYVTCP